MQSFKNRMDVVRFLSFTHVFLSWSIDWLETYLDTCIKVRFWLPALRWICSPGRIQVEGMATTPYRNETQNQCSCLKYFVCFDLWHLFYTSHRACFNTALPFKSTILCIVWVCVFSKCVPCVCSKCVPCARLRVCCVCVRVRVCVCVAGFRTLICLCVNAGEFVFHAHAYVYVWLLEKKKEKKSSF